MTPYVFGLVGLRIVAVYVAAEILTQLMYMYSFMMRGSLQAADFVSWGVYGLCAVSGIALWMLAPRLSAMATRGIEQADEVRFEWTAQGIQRIALTMIGVWLVVWAIPGVVMQTSSYLKQAEMLDETVAWSELLTRYIPDVVQLIIGFLLILGAGFWSALLVRIQRFGLKGKS